MDGSRLAAIETAVSETDIVASSGCNFNITTLVHTEKLKNNVIVGNIGRFDSEIDFADSEDSEGMKVATFRPTRTTSTSCQELYEKRAKLYFSCIDTELTLTQGQAISAGVKVEGPFRNQHYSY